MPVNRDCESFKKGNAMLEIYLIDTNQKVEIHSDHLNNQEVEIIKNSGFELPFSEEHQAYEMDSENFEWWDNWFKANDEVHERIEALKENNSAFQGLSIDDYTDLENFHSRFNAAIDEFENDEENHIVYRLKNSKSLSELAEILNGMTEHESKNLVSGVMAELPTFGGDPIDQEGVFSWDTDNILIFAEMQQDSFVIEPRE